jgi:hypothetical protein
MRASGEKRVQPLRRLRNRIRPRHTDQVKAVGARRRGKRRLRCGRSQKSRLA